MSVSKKLNIAFISLIVIIFLCLSLLLQQFYRIENHVEETVDTRIVQLQVGKEIQRALATQGMFIRAYLLEPSDFNLERLTSYNALLQDEITKLSNIENDATMTEYITKLNNSAKTLIETANTIVSIINSGNETTALNMINTEFSTSNAEIFKLTVAIQEHQQQQLNETVSTTQNTISLSTILAVIALITNVGIIAGLMFFVYIKIASPLRRVAIEADFIAGGDLTRAEYIYPSKDEIGKLSAAFNQMKTNLRGVLGSIQVNIEHLSASAEELAASTEEIRSTSEDVAHRVTNTTEIAMTTSTIAKESATAMDETSEGIQKIAQSSLSLLESSGRRPSFHIKRC